ncbi:MAG TPA: methylglyoxal synthase [Cyanobacteria bacterium UBA11149]|nr:methylglyoxal synthase [Cyanobacteria bacterium UBA11367]HBE57767.1 methylglyoxal synthase [Cyanobacteria bacterium UBA11366]HBK62981.1 methylglyoxal synthase [Cyanobacteria bacterium UBA11166]HBR77262.1 methylglyoxal synthase [Cyanobacteria bacterium UBA11159]HBS69374.1 methylglyoxal synthase [Cyanobacteria bacterium UBA11153]HBW90105.1 methylglyoxal synthase [Cyanobacteria bacterium UBA11149]HCA94975.1 methylglyoxal synthase [Cyanobacteria bacterium UBA9226]
MSQTIALIAHDRKKDDIVNFAKQHAGVLSRYKLMATATTGGRIQQGANLQVERLLSGALGGDVQIAAQVAANEVIAVIFLIDTLYTQPHEPDIQTLLRICNLHNVPLATNLATAEAIIAKLGQNRCGYLIFNPVSGQGNAEKDLALIQQLLKPEIHLEVYLTNPDTNVVNLAKDAIATGVDLIIASGGDGTVSAVAGATIGTGIPLGVIPRGTANAFAAALGIPSNIKRACEIILAGTTHTIDAARCNLHPIILLAGIGFEAETVERADREAKKLLGPLAYILAGMQQLNEHQIFDTEIEVEGVVSNCQAGAITIANAAPSTSVLAQGMGQVIPNDGLLEVTISTQNTKMEAIDAIIDLLGAALMKSAVRREDTISFRTQEIKVTTNPPQKVVVDGEIIGTTPVEIQCIPHGLTVIAPVILPVTPAIVSNDSENEV